MAARFFNKRKHTMSAASSLKESYPLIKEYLQVAYSIDLDDYLIRKRYPNFSDYKELPPCRSPEQFVSNSFLSTRYHTKLGRNLLCLTITLEVGSACCYYYLVHKDHTHLCREELKLAKKPPCPHGYQDLATQLVNIIKLIKNKELEYPYGILFNGSPGNGKTMLCRHLAKAANVSSFSYSDATLANAITNDTIFNSGDIYILDDIGPSWFRRGDPQCHMLLQALDGLKSTASLRIICTNDDISNFDSAMMRPGRIDDVVHFDNPTKEQVSDFVNTFNDETKQHMDIDKLSDYSYAQIDGVRKYIERQKTLNLAIDLDQVYNGEQNQKQKIGFAT